MLVVFWPARLIMWSQVLCETDEFVAVSKPACMPVHTVGQYRKNTVLGVLEAERPDLGLLYPTYRQAWRSLHSRGQAYSACHWVAALTRDEGRRIRSATRLQHWQKLPHPYVYILPHFVEICFLNIFPQAGQARVRSETPAGLVLVQYSLFPQPIPQLSAPYLRLDKPVSGLLLLARSSAVAGRMRQQLEVWGVGGGDHGSCAEGSCGTDEAAARGVGGHEGHVGSTQ